MFKWFFASTFSLRCKLSKERFTSSFVFNLNWLGGILLLSMSVLCVMVFYVLIMDMCKLYVLSILCKRKTFRIAKKFFCVFCIILFCMNGEFFRFMMFIFVKGDGCVLKYVYVSVFNVFVVGCWSCMVLCLLIFRAMDTWFSFVMYSDNWYMCMCFILFMCLVCF